MALVSVDAGIGIYSVIRAKASGKKDGHPIPLTEHEILRRVVCVKFCKLFFRDMWSGTIPEVIISCFERTALQLPMPRSNGAKISLWERKKLSSATCRKQDEAVNKTEQQG